MAGQTQRKVTVDSLGPIQPVDNQHDLLPGGHRGLCRRAQDLIEPTRLTCGFGHHPGWGEFINEVIPRDQLRCQVAQGRRRHMSPAAPSEMAGPAARPRQPRREGGLPEACVGLHHNITSVVRFKEPVDLFHEPFAAGEPLDLHFLENRGGIKPDITQTREFTYENVSGNDIAGRLDNGSVPAGRSSLLERD